MHQREEIFCGGTQAGMEKSGVCLHSVYLRARYSDLELIGAMKVAEGRLQPVSQGFEKGG